MVPALATGLTQRLAMTEELFKSPVLCGLTLVRGLRSMALMALVTILPLYFGNELDLGPFNRGFHIGMLIAVGLAAKPLAGLLSDKLGRNQVLVPGLVLPLRSADNRVRRRHISDMAGKSWDEKAPPSPKWTGGAR